MKSTWSLFFATGLALTAIANDAQWRGANRDGHYDGTGILTAWPETGPPLLWAIDSLEPGYGAPSVAATAIYLTGTRQGAENLIALDLNGEVIWQAAMGPSYEGDFQMARCTPTVTQDQVYVISSAGRISCFDAQSGAQTWAVDGYTQFNGSWGIWGTSENPLVVDGKVIYTPGGEQTTMVALDAKTGETVWQTKSLKDKSAYASPTVFSHSGRQVIANVSANYIFGVDAKNGEILWKYSYGTLDAPPVEWGAPFVNTITPVYHNGAIYTTSGYNHVGAKFNLAETGKDITVAWTDTTLDTHHGGVVLVDGTLYGANWINNRTGNWCAIDWQTGKASYETKWQTKGSIITAGGMLICYDEKDGEVALVKADPSGFKPISSFTVKGGSGPHWSHPVIAHKHLYMRHGNALMAYDLAAD